MTVLVTLTLAGSDTGPFNLYSNIDYVTPLVTGVAKSTLTSGYTLTGVPEGATYIRVKSTQTCTSYIDLLIAGNTTTTTSTTSSTTSTTTTPAPEYQLAQKGRTAKPDGCPTITVLNIYLNASDTALFIANGGEFAGLGGGASTTCTAIARNAVGTPITGRLFDEQNITWELSSGSFTYAEFQC